MFACCTVYVFRSSSVDTPPVETISSSETLPEDVKITEKVADVVEEKVEEPPRPPEVTEPPHTSPDISFASEVTSQKHHLTVTNMKVLQRRHCETKSSLLAGSAENHPAGSREPGRQRQHDGRNGEGQERPLRQDQCRRVFV